MLKTMTAMTVSYQAPSPKLEPKVINFNTLSYSQLAMIVRGLNPSTLMRLAQSVHGQMYRILRGEC